MSTSTVTWYVMASQSPASVGIAVEPGVAGIDIPDDVMAWAESHGLSADDPDVYLLVAVDEDAGPLDGQVAVLEGTISAADGEAVARQAATEADERRQREAERP